MDPMEEFYGVCTDAVRKALAGIGAPPDLRIVTEIPDSADLAVPCFTL